MSEKSTHKQTKAKIAGKTGKTEVPIRGGKMRVDVLTKHKAVEVERGGASNLEKAAQRLKATRKPQKVLVVPQHNMSKARAAMRRVGISGTVRNIRGTRRTYVPKVNK